MIKCGDPKCGGCENPNYEPGDRRFLYEFLKANACEDMAFIDIGAHAGLYVHSLAEMLSKEAPQCTMLSIDPDVDVLKVLHQNTAPHPVINAALWNEDSVVFLRNHDRPSSQGYVNPKDDGGVIPVVATTLDKIIKYIPSDLSVLALKIDAEGAEDKIIEGAKKTLARVKIGALMIELSIPHLERCDSSLDNLLSNLSAAGYNPIRPEAIDKVKKGHKCNVHFIKGCNS